MGAMAFQITGVPIYYLTACSGRDQRKHQNSASLAFVRGIHRWPVNSPHKRPVTRKMFQFDDVFMPCREWVGKGIHEAKRSLLNEKSQQIHNWWAPNMHEIISRQTACPLILKDLPICVFALFLCEFCILKNQHWNTLGRHLPKSLLL